MFTRTQVNFHLNNLILSNNIYKKEEGKEHFSGYVFLSESRKIVIFKQNLQSF